MEEDIEKIIWQNVRPAADAAEILSIMGLPYERIAEFEDRWKTVTLPYLNNVTGYAARCAAEVDRRIAFAEKCKASILEDYGNTLVSFAARRRLMEVRLPVVDAALAKLRGWRRSIPSIEWTPDDAADIKAAGLEKFIRFNIERFYER